MAGNRHPKDDMPTPQVPFPDAKQWRQDARRRLDQQRQQSGNLSDDPPDNPVRDPRPFRNLRGR